MRELEIGISAAKQAGEYLLSVFGSCHSVRFKSDNSPVTDADLVSSTIVKKAISEAFPNHSILCEELPDALSRTIGPEPTWVIDPLDGTSNFIANIPLFAVVIGYVVGGETQLGIIYDPLHSDLFVAQAGKGASLNGKPMRVSTKNGVRGAMLFAGRGYRDRDHEKHGQIIYALEQQTTYFRRLGSAAIMLASVASGRADSVILTGNKPWDVVAGALLITEAGGRVTDYCGNPWTVESEDLVATNGLIHDELISITHAQDKEACL
ncbi:inositol monophosphatase [Candidatus Uhrbacteria bacterium]|nr:inositol monophosphatase [Candidatus Uhrbacteria bacterium]